ncbi:MAG: hypothetical protein NC191_03770 [Muribaculaceae bacterium]|nr:hypothetical protein [Muribaculaceae bacterium]
MNAGFIKLHRQFLKWEWYDDVNVKVLFLHCLFRANWEEQKWHGKLIPRGSFVTSLAHLVEETGLSVQQVRTALKKLKSTQEITSLSQGSNTLITIKNYSKFQDNNKDSNKEVTSYQQRGNKEVTTIEEEKKNKEDKNISLSIDEKITEDEREILKKHIQKQTPKVQNISAYIRTILDNGDYIHILNEEKAKAQRRLEIVKSSPPKEIQEPDDPIENRKAFEDFKAKLSNLRKMEM